MEDKPVLSRHLILPDISISQVNSDNSVTSFDYKQIQYFKGVKGLSLKNPTIIGFGISDKESFEQACKYSHGAIIGTKFIKEISNGNLRESIKDFIAIIKS